MKKKIYKVIYKQIMTGTYEYPIYQPLFQYVFDYEHVMLLKKLHPRCRVEEIEVEL